MNIPTTFSSGKPIIRANEARESFGNQASQREKVSSWLSHLLREDDAVVVDNWEIISSEDHEKMGCLLLLLFLLTESSLLISCLLSIRFVAYHREMLHCFPLSSPYTHADFKWQSAHTRRALYHQWQLVKPRLPAHAHPHRGEQLTRLK